MNSTPSNPAGRNSPEPTADEVAAALAWAQSGSPAGPDAGRHAGVLAAEVRRRQIADALAAKSRTAQKPPAEALDELVRFACGNRTSSSAIVVRDILASIFQGSRNVNFGRVTRFDDRNCALLVAVLDGLLVGTRGRIYDVHIKAAFQRHGGESFLFAE